GALPMCLSARQGGRNFVLPAASAAEAALVENFCILPARSLAEVCAHLTGQQPIAPYAGGTPTLSPVQADLIDVRGQLPAKRVLEVAAAGGHSLLLIGPPGTGKSMLAARLPALLPPPSEQEALESAAMQSLVHGHFDLTRWKQRPYRAPHHTASAVALVGGGALARPGEISLADHGVLFLDELAEFPRAVLEALREPLETGRVNISRAARRIDYPARFQLICAMNPCPCGFHGSQEQGESRCRCTPDQVLRYRNKLSGPLLDRIDLAAEVPILPAADLQGGASGDNSATVARRVAGARSRQSERQGRTNARLDAGDIDQHCPLDGAARSMLAQATERLRLSARAYHRILKVARTLADLADSTTLRREHVAEAVQYRRLLAEWTH
ncbi:MAG TPA: YifB family Mg chelatase-like AAA ATPase, partial [Rhodocyclaceae bacterium]|nr:YifB family Mg chelatase-like AAA ATPase [Rhodocyclaceae bacterium]